MSLFSVVAFSCTKTKKGAAVATQLEALIVCLSIKRKELCEFFILSLTYTIEIYPSLKHELA